MRKAYRVLLWDAEMQGKLDMKLGLRKTGDAVM
jgi:hypothetical protein